MTALRYTVAALAAFVLAAVVGSLAARWSFDRLPPSWFDLDEPDILRPSE